jgi:alpha-glucosidase (family GH31 glycosyl hydrolase)
VKWNKRKNKLKLTGNKFFFWQTHWDKDESGREEEEVIVFDGETTVDVDVDALGEDVVWQEEELEFEDVEEPGKDEEEPGKDEEEQAQGRLEELQIQLESKRPAR